MSIKSFFRKMTGRPARSLEAVDEMYTRRINISEDKKRPLFVQFVAERKADGYWKIFDISDNEWQYLPLIHSRQHIKAVQKVFSKHLGRNSKEDSMNFDEAFLILRELEESYLKYTGKQAGPEPFDHYTAAFRLVPTQFHESMEEIYQKRRGEGDILPPREPKSDPKNFPKPF